ncbi:snRNA-activating protein complex subunit 2 [Sorex araneus]|uniref:snRNA-activating protein complex subunit 2 n=1 Tax=Sorex araneus TaxID=42254 RepID=UPI0024335C18|nr:snRNA-activating protein complex subunit 2 [Sorex araneus]
MKPPQRRRAAPARYLGELSGPAAWSAREKRQLLRLLQARRGQPEPEAAELARELPGRSEAEVRDFLRHLKGCVAREAIQKVYPGGAQGSGRQETQTPAPIEVWLDLVEKMTGPLEEALMVAFSQVLTIAATEPISLLHSIPPKPTQARGRPVVVSAPAGQENPTAEPSCPAPKARCLAPDPLGSISVLGTPGSVPGAPDPALKPPSPAPSIPGPAPSIPGPTPSIPGPTQETPGPAPSIPDPGPKIPGPAPPDPLEPPGDFTVDFEKIYKYLSSLSRSGHGPELSAAESAVVLDLLLALPDELQHLPCGALVQHLSDAYQHMTAPQPDLASAGSPPRVTDARTDTDAHQASPTPSQALGSTEPRDSRSPWQVSGICPLNPFLVPLELLGRAASPDPARGAGPEDTLQL